jgi:hypothetical protein
MSRSELPSHISGLSGMGLHHPIIQVFVSFRVRCAVGHDGTEPQVVASKKLRHVIIIEANLTRPANSPRLPSANPPRGSIWDKSGPPTFARLHCERATVGKPTFATGLRRLGINHFERSIRLDRSCRRSAKREGGPPTRGCSL